MSRALQITWFATLTRSGPLSQPAAEDFTDFDGQQTNLIGSLHLDADEEPRRVGATSRANSVRFDESANQGHWSHASRNSVDLISRTGSAMSGAHPLIERTYSHKSDGRQSSAGHSVHSATSGRANSLGIETAFGLPSGSPSDLPGLAPGLFILGATPAIFRCWMTTNFKHDALLYAAACTGSFTSFISSALIDELGFGSRVSRDLMGGKKIKLNMYLPEAITHPASSRSNSPAPQLPYISVDFTVRDQPRSGGDYKAVQVFLGSDALRAHNADVLFSSNVLTLFDEERSKLSIPLVRPEDERAFRSLEVSDTSQTFTGFFTPKRSNSALALHNGEAEQQPSPSIAALAARDDSVVSTQHAEDLAQSDAGHDRLRNVDFDLGEDRMEEAKSYSPRPGLSAALSSASATRDEGSSSSSTAPTGSRSGASPAIWNNWRRENEPPKPQLDWAAASKGTATPASNYQRRDQGIKVLKPLKSTSRSASSAMPAVSSPAGNSPATGQSRFFDDGKRRPSLASAGSSAGGAGGGNSSNNGGPDFSTIRRTTSAAVGEPKHDAAQGSAAKDGAANGKTRPANPAGGASAFSWLNSGSGQR